MIADYQKQDEGQWMPKELTESMISAVLSNFPSLRTVTMTRMVWICFYDAYERQRSKESGAA